jgi:xanthine phosphoribosyltransferase
MTIDQKIEFLKKKFLDVSFVKDAKQGYVVVKDFNLAIDPDILQIASRCWAEKYHHIKDVDAIVGLPDAGARLVSVLADMLRIKRILPSKRIDVAPGAWENVVRFQNSSFTTGKDEVISQIGFVKPGMKILVVDDVIAHGTTAIAAVSALQAAGAEVVGIAVLFDKAWQNGVVKIKAETGVEAYSLVSINEINSQGEVILK